MDLSDLVNKGVFKAWMQAGFFEQMTVTTSGSITWPGDIDLCPDSLYLSLTGKQSEEIFSTLYRAYA